MGINEGEIDRIEKTQYALREAQQLAKEAIEQVKNGGNSLALVSAAYTALQNAINVLSNFPELADLKAKMQASCNTFAYNTHIQVTRKYVNHPGKEYLSTNADHGYLVSLSNFDPNSSYYVYDVEAHKSVSKHAKASALPLTANIDTEGVAALNNLLDLIS